MFVTGTIDEQPLASLKARAVAEVIDLVGKATQYRFGELGVLAWGGHALVIQGAEAASRSVVLKVLFQFDAGILADFQKEAELGLGICSGCPYIVDYFDAHVADKPPHFIVMEHLGTKTLCSIVSGVVEMSVIHEIVRHAIDTCRGLEHLHSHGRIHGDVKPANIVVAGEGRAKLIDLSSTISFPRKVIYRSRCAAPYRSWELECAAELSPASDMYSLGVTLYEVLAGRLPFENSDRFVFDHERTTPVPIGDLNPSVPAQLAELVMAMLRKNLSKRPQSAADVISVLEKVVDTCD